MCGTLCAQTSIDLIILVNSGLGSFPVRSRVLELVYLAWKRLLTSPFLCANFSIIPGLDCKKKLELKFIKNEHHLESICKSDVWSKLLEYIINKNKWINFNRAQPGIEPGTSRTLSENHTPRPLSLPFAWGIQYGHFDCFAIQLFVVREYFDGFDVTLVFVSNSDLWPFIHIYYFLITGFCWISIGTYLFAFGALQRRHLWILCHVMLLCVLTRENRENQILLFVPWIIANLIIVEHKNSIQRHHGYANTESSCRW